MPDLPVEPTAVQQAAIHPEDSAFYVRHDIENSQPVTSEIREISAAAKDDQLVFLAVFLGGVVAARLLIRLRFR